MRRANFNYPMYLSFASTTGADGTRSNGATQGTSVTPGASSTYPGSYTDLGVLDANNDVYWIDVVVHTAQVSAAKRMIMIKLAADPAGGTSYTDFWNGILVGGPFVWTTNGLAATRIRVPFFLKAGTSLGVKAASLDATTTAIRVWVDGVGKPNRPDFAPVGRKITTFGVTEPTVGGTAVTPGTTSEGSWTRIGSTSFSGDEFYLNVGAMMDTTGANTADLQVDVAIGNGTNFTEVIRDLAVSVNALEALSFISPGAFIRPKAGENVYVRAQSSAAVASQNFSFAIYAVS